MRNRPFLVGLFCVTSWVGLFAGAMVSAQTADQTRFDSPEAGLKALIEAAKNKDLPQLRKILGVEAKELASGDEVQDKDDLEDFAKRLAAAAKLERDGDERVTILVGPEAHPFCVPLVRNKDGKWFFDTPAGKEELMNRRIGENEIKALRVCRGIIDAQREYYQQDANGDGIVEYAARLSSSPGKRDGLYWETKDNEPPSPLGPLVADAQAEGYSHGKTTSQPAAGPRPYHGYVYRILTRQGEHAPGGKFDYMINGHMVAGFALVAYPVDWGNSGVMTFLVNTNGKVYEKNLGEKTEELAAKMDTYDPDDSWAVSKD